MYQLTMNQGFQLPLDRLYNAWKDPGLIRKWFAPGDMEVDAVEVDFKVGGAYRIAMKNPAGQQFVIGGEYLEIIEEKRLVFSWKWEHVPHTTKVEVDFETVDSDSSQLTLVHSEFLSEPERASHADGWEGILASMKQLEIGME